MELSLHSQVDSSIIRFNSGKHWHFLKECASGSMTFLSLPVLTYLDTHFTNSTSIFQTFSQITTVLQPQLWFCIELLMLSSKLRSTWNIATQRGYHIILSSFEAFMTLFSCCYHQALHNICHNKSCV